MLLDADGVIQLTPPSFRERLAALVADDLASQFLTDVFAAEQGPLLGDGDFRTALDAVLQKWAIRAPVDEVLHLWCDIEPIAGLDELLAHLRRLGMSPCLATNQQQHRAQLMNEQLGYAERFDACFYSCDIGARKPDERYFHTVLTHLQRPAAEVAFVDDHPDNVEAARCCGLRALLFDANRSAAPAADLRAQLSGVFT